MRGVAPVANEAVAERQQEVKGATPTRSGSGWWAGPREPADRAARLIEHGGERDGRGVMNERNRVAELGVAELGVAELGARRWRTRGWAFGLARQISIAGSSRAVGSELRGLSVTICEHGQ